MDNVTSNAIENVYWDLTLLNGDTVKNEGQGQNTIHFILNSKDSSITGYSGCNRFFGKYTIEEGNQIRFSKMASTKRACFNNTINEQTLLSVFNDANNFTITGNILRLNVGKKAALAEFHRRLDFADSINGKYWKLLTLNGKEVTMGKNQEKEQYFKLIANDNTIEGFGGCNGFGGSFSLGEGNSITFSNMLSTMMYCEGLPVSENAYFSVFETANNYTILNDTLSLNVGKRAPLATFVAVYF